MSWLEDVFNPRARLWEEFYRARWEYDRVARSSHGVNCTGSCSWLVYVKDGLISWELQALDYPPLEAGLPPYEPRGCPRGATYSWYIYSPLRVKYPYVRGSLVDLWRRARSAHDDPVQAWATIVENPQSRRLYQEARGKGGFRRASWDEVLELVAAATVHTVKKHGPDRICGFTPIPGMSMVSFAGGSRFLQLLGGVDLSFYDWYCDLPPASPEVFGDQTDVAESADWFNARYIVAVGSNICVTRTPDAHFVTEARQNGTKFVCISPDFSDTSKLADWWLPARAGEDGALWMAVGHVILNEFLHEHPVPYFLDYLRRYTDAPFLVELEKHDDGSYTPGRLLRAGRLERYHGEEKAEWKFLVLDRTSGQPRMPQGTVGFRWQERKGQWNLELRDGLDNAEIDPLLTLLDAGDGALPVTFADHAGGQSLTRGVPIRYIQTGQGPVPVAAIYDLLMAQYGVSRGLPGDYPADYNDDAIPYTPAWQEGGTGIDREMVVRLAREWASTAAETKGRCMVIIGAGANQWYQNDVMYRAVLTALMVCGCVGRNGGGLNHYVGQEKVTPFSSWALLATAQDWEKPPRLMNAPSFFYMHSDQWRYEERPLEPTPEAGGRYGFLHGHTADVQARAVRMGWLPFYPQFDRNPLQVVRQAKEAGANDHEEIAHWIVGQLREKKLRFAVEDPDAPENWPRVWFLWRANGLQASAKGAEYFQSHLLGTHSNAVADEIDASALREIVWREPAPTGKLDLLVDVNFRMDTSAVYADVVLPAATWYEKDDLNTTDMHEFIHPFSAAVPPCWESRTDWDIFRDLAEKVSELARTHLSEPVHDVVAAPLLHDTASEVAQPEVKDWALGECEPEPGKTMPKLAVVERDYVNLFHRYVSLGPLLRKGGLGAKGVHWEAADLYDELLATQPTVEWGGKRYPSLRQGIEAANTILALAPETNGEVAYRAFKTEEGKTGRQLADLAAPYRGTRYTFDDLLAQPRRVLTSPCWTGITNAGRAYAPFCINVERLVPWHTLTGRQHFYLDHEGFLAYGEALPTYKPKPTPTAVGDLDVSRPAGGAILLNCLTPHGKWHIHTTYQDDEPMLTLSRGVEPIWLNDADAAELDVRDNDWLEVYNDHGVVVTRAVVSARIPRGVCMYYHAQERTVSVPKSPVRGNRRAGADNSLTHILLKPTLMAGGYGQFTYFFNYWGPPAPNRDTYVLVRRLARKPNW